MDRFETLYSNLNTSQKEAVDTIEGPVMVIAGPGTGKTTILTLRIANILKTTDTPPSGILAITFTDAGVKAMKGKLRDLIGSRADEVRIHTFHGFAASIISEFPEHFIETAGFTQMTDIEKDALIASILEDKKFASLRPLGKPDLYIGPLIGAISDAKRDAFTPSDIKKFALEEIDCIKNDEASISTRGASKGELKAEAKKHIEKLEKSILFADVFEAYEAQKKAKKLLDFDDLIFNVILAFGKDELLLRLVQEKFLYLLVDEHQDTNDSQNLLVRMIASFFENPNLFIVGDEKQAIYRFQGASVENFLKFEKAWPAMKVISLEQNYRSHQHILDASFGMIEKNYEEGEHQKLRVKLEAGNKNKARHIDVYHPATRDDAEAFLVHELKRISKDEPEKTVALISRTNKDVDRMLHVAEGQGIEISAERSVDIFSHPIGSLFFSLISFIKDPLNVEALGRTLVAGLWHVPFSEALILLKKLKKGEVEEAIQNIKSLHRIQAMLSDDSPMFFLIRLAEESGFDGLVVKDPVYVEVWRGILSLAEQIIKQYAITNPSMLLERLSAYKESAERKAIKIKAGESKAKIQAMTAHGSKGLEFDYVFIPYATEESWLPRKRSSHFVLPTARLEKEGDDIRDARRLFYVALTRAKDHAVILSPLEDAGDLNTPLRFIDELEQSSILRKTIPEGVQVEAMPKLVSKEKGKRIVEFAKAYLLENGLSVTALNHFLECPSNFLFKSVLRLPEMPTAVTEKGTAMHLAFDHIWKEEESRRTEEEIVKIIRTVAEGSVRRSYLRGFEKEAVIADIEKSASVVAKSLLSHFHTKGEVMVEEWSETHFDAAYEGEAVPVRLHGKLDAVIDTGKEVLVFDYKTMKKMSVAEIKGETKNSDGKYFRQLVFYKMLLCDEPSRNGKHILPALVFITPDEKGNCHIQGLDIEDKDIENLKANIQELVNSVWSGEVVKGTCKEEKCEHCDLLNVIKEK